jgi:type I restriction enzyme S subunit
VSVTEWVGSTPPSWPLARIKHLCRTAGGGTPDKGKPEYWQGDIPWVSPKDMKSDRITDTEDHITTEGLSNSATQMVPPNSVLLVMRSGILRHSIPVAINQVPVSLNQDMRAFLCDERLAPRFLARLIEGHQAELLQAWSKVGATVESLESDFIGDTLIPLPPRPEQEAIMSFLDRETSRLDALVAAKQRVLDLLAEKRKAIIATAVTRGLDPKVKLRDSGVPWLGEIPAHWEIERARWLFRERDQRGNPELPLMEVSIANGVSVREFSDERIETTAADFNTYKIARKDDVVLNKMRMWQGAVGISPTDGLVSPDYVVAEPVGAILPEYAGLLFRTAEFSAECGRRSHGLTWDRLRIYWDEFREIETPLPPASEQSAIVDHVMRETGKLDAVRAATERTIALLKERRSALIAAAVTGQLDLTTEEGAGA